MVIMTIIIIMYRTGLMTSNSQSARSTRVQSVVSVTCSRCAIEGAPACWLLFARDCVEHHVMHRCYHILPPGAVVAVLPLNTAGDAKPQRLGPQMQYCGRPWSATAPRYDACCVAAPSASSHLGKNDGWCLRTHTPPRLICRAPRFGAAFTVKISCLLRP